MKGFSACWRAAFLGAALFCGVATAGTRCLSDVPAWNALGTREEGVRHFTDIVSTFPFWFCPDFIRCVNRDAELPWDQHQLLALVADGFPPPEKPLQEGSIPSFATSRERRRILCKCGGFRVFRGAGVFRVSVALLTVGHKL